MPKMKRSDQDQLYDVISDLEGLIGDAMVLNQALMVLIDKPDFQDIAQEMIRHGSGTLHSAKARVHEGYKVAARLGVDHG